MDNNFCADSPILLKAKFDAWSDYTNISELPRCFLDLVKLFSTLLYPNNFSINYLDFKKNIHSINCDNKYREAVIDCISNSSLELKLMVTVYRDNKIINVDKSVIKRNSLIKHSDIILEEDLSDKSGSDNSSLNNVEFFRQGKKKRSKKQLILCL